ncbi:MAG: hypothetical protein COT33_02415 [Candidatus Nealsonbacteria bacterium CG08_land_8_20_14_0_20_38_20]|uniref:Uncharacterized protein n=1 Tax=Candidatus Nealsonbacteria bacterium CG08_land_8_20_14_0_20_38_20 TaxID=1974705 RepID=A0A2H0YLH9_9BACT|nr:MAG: hypothetical protein COT33_02415 [Candidatus Nealsonbacteria bacterium CG08_land_8_20_14_0_20_38_20]
MATITIPKRITKGEELIVIPRKEYEGYLELKEKIKEQITEEDVLRWSREAKRLKKTGKLPLLRSLEEIR